MANFAIINTTSVPNKVINIIVAEDQATADSLINAETTIAVEYEDGVSVGMEYDSEAGTFIDPPLALPEGFNADAFKEILKVAIKAEAKTRIEALAWKIERATEQDAINGTTTVNDVYAEREAIRARSNAIETELDALTEDMDVYTFPSALKFDE